MDIEIITQTVHAAIRAWAKALDGRDMPAWDDAPQWMRDSTMESVQFVLDHPDAGPGAQHRQWMEQKQKAGWTFAPTRDDELKYHPSLIPFEDLPLSEQKKDRLVCAIVMALRDEAD